MSAFVFLCFNSAPIRRFNYYLRALSVVFPRRFKLKKIPGPTHFFARDLRINPAMNGFIPIHVFFEFKAFVFRANAVMKRSLNPHYFGNIRSGFSHKA